MALIPLYHRGVVVGETLVDAEDEAMLLERRWRLSLNGYAVTAIGRDSAVGMHRILLGLVKGDGIDGEHRNGNRLDNRRFNLRRVTRSQNLQAVLARPHSSRYRGVGWNRQQQKWQAWGKVNGRMVHHGYYDDEEEAARVAAAWRATNHTLSREVW